MGQHQEEIRRRILASLEGPSAWARYDLDSAEKMRAFRKIPEGPASWSDQETTHRIGRAFLDRSLARRGRLLPSRQTVAQYLGLPEETVRHKYAQLAADVHPIRSGFEVNSDDPAVRKKMTARRRRTLETLRAVTEAMARARYRRAKSIKAVTVPKLPDTPGWRRVFEAGLAVDAAGGDGLAAVRQAIADGYGACRACRAPLPDAEAHYCRNDDGALHRPCVQQAYRRRAVKSD